MNEFDHLKELNGPKCCEHGIDVDEDCPRCEAEFQAWGGWKRARKIKHKRRVKCAYCDKWGDPTQMLLAPEGRVYRSEAHHAHRDCYNRVFR